MIETICNICDSKLNDKCTKIHSFPIDYSWIEECIINPKDEKHKNINIKRLKQNCRYSGKIL